MIQQAKERLGRLLHDRLRPHRTRRHSAHFENVLGTSLETQVVSETDDGGPAAVEAALAEIDRLEAIFSGYTPSSEIWRWQATIHSDEPVSAELAEVLEASEFWRARTGGAFNPAVEYLTRLWSNSSNPDQALADPTMVDLIRALDAPLCRVDHKRGTARRLTALPVTLNAIAKGYIIDLACLRAARIEGVREVLVNIGGDLRHFGTKAISVGITNPFAAADNAPPVEVVKIRNQGMATSGNYRRGVRIGDRWYSHLIDPRNGRPTEHVVSATVIADSAAVADVLSTAFSVLAPAESIRMADSIPGVACLLIDQDGQYVWNGAWRKHSALRASGWS